MKTPSLSIAPLALASVLLGANIAQAQTYTPTNRFPVADKTAIGTQVSGSNNNFSITGGLQRGQTLFHSFGDFSVPTNGQANFANPVGNRDIITRVTGGLFSDINGIVSTQGANFFLINPNGVVFGPNARLNVGKAFVGSTANSIDLVDGSGRTITFGANANGDAPLLTINPNVFFNVSRLNMGGGGSGAISNFGTLQTNNPNQYIGLIGGNVSMNGGQINAPGGRVEIGGLSAFGTVALGTDVNNLRAEFPANVGRGDVSLTNGARVNVAGAGGGDIAISARNLDIFGGSTIRGGIRAGLGTHQAVAGDIKLNATGSIVVDGSNSGIVNLVRLNSMGNAGNITVDTNSFALTNGAQLAASTLGQGNAGNVVVTAKDAVSLVNGTILSTVEAGGVGKGGTIDINSASLSLTKGAQINTITRGASATQPAGQGDTGNITVNVSGAVDIAGINGIFPSGLLNYVDTGAKGNAGNITVNAGSFSLTNGAKLRASTYGQGNAGNVTVTAKEAISLAGNSYILSTVESGGVGKGGTIDIHAGSLSLQDGAQLLTITSGASATQPAGQGDAGNITVNVTGAVDINGINNEFSSGISSAVETGTKGNGGNITVNAGSFSLTNGAQIVASTFGQGNAGNVTVTAKDAVSLAGQSYIFSTVEPGGVGKGGTIDINAGSLSLQDGAQLLTITRHTSDLRPAGQGDAGNITVKVSGAIDITGGNKNRFATGMFSSVGKGTKGNGGNITVDAGSFALTNGGGIAALGLGAGNAGNITISAGSFSLTSDGAIDSSSYGQGNTGNIFLNGDHIVLNNSDISSKSASYTGGNITINTKDYLLLQNNSLIATDSDSTGKNGNGGNITISSPLIITLPGNNDITANAYQGTGGQINITSQGLFGIQYRPKGQDSPFTNDITASSTFGQNGIVNISTPGTDPGRDQGALTAAPNDASKQISQACSASQQDNKFYITGRGGLPPNASEPQESEALWADPRAVKPQPVAGNPSSQTTRKFAPPAVGWIFDGKGKVTLISSLEDVPVGTKVLCPQTGK